MPVLDRPEEVNNWKKALVSIWALFECFLYTGIYYGWGALEYVLKEEGIYRSKDLCKGNQTLNSSRHLGLNSTHGPTETLENVKCVPQDDKFALCFTLASLADGASSGVMGYINSKKGTRVGRLVSFTILTVGLMCLALVSKDFPWLIYPGMILCAAAGLGLYITVAQVSNIFKKYNATYLSFLTGAWDASPTVFLFVKLVHQSGFPRRNTFLIMVGLHGCTLVSTFLFLPRGFVRKAETRERDTSIRVSEDGAVKNEHKDDRLPAVKRKRVLTMLTRPLFISFVLWFSILHMRLYCYLGTFNVFLNVYLKQDQDKVSHYTDVAFYVTAMGLFTAVGVGAIYDRLKAVYNKKSGSQLYQSLAPAVFPMACASILSALYSVLILTRFEPLLYGVFVVSTLGRSFQYSMFTAYISAVFPVQYFGILFGIAYMSGSAIGCLQYAFFRWAEAYDDGRFHTEICLLVISLLSLGHPLYMWVSAIKACKLERSTSTKLHEQPNNSDGQSKDEINVSTVDGTINIGFRE